MELEPEPVLSFPIAIETLLSSTTLIAFNTEFAVNSIQCLLTDAELSSLFTGLVIILIFSIDPMCISLARKDEMHISITLTLEKCI